MDNFSDLTDPYEQKLYQMFSTYGMDSQGSINVDSLRKLCKSLELKETGAKIIRALVKNRNDSTVRVTFRAFKEELLHVLGTEIDTTSIGHQQQQQQAGSDDATSNNGKEIGESSATLKVAKNRSESPSREVSPKLVVGSKKYGRRTRPQITSDLSTAESESESSSELDQKKNEAQNKSLNKVHRSASQSDVKRRREPRKGSKLKRCASLPAQRNMERSFPPTRGSSPKLNSQLESSLDSLGDLDVEHLSQNLYEIWIELCSELHANSNELKSRDELEQVFLRVGIMDKVSGSLAGEVYEKLGFAAEESVNFQQFIALIQSDDNMLYLTNNCTNLRCNTNTNKLGGFLEAKGSNEIDAGDQSSGFGDQRNSNIVSSEIIVDMWEAVGVTNAAQLLKYDLAFDGDEINITQLSAAIDEELNGLRGDCREDEKVGMNLLRASLTLHKAEVQGLQVALKQLADENQKLYASNRDSNDRVALLAQEVDERHATIENSTRQEIRALEQKHAENVREITLQLEQDREQFTLVNGKLEARIKQLEMEEQRLKSENGRIEGRNVDMEAEQMSLQKQMAELLETNIKLNNEICDLEDRYKSFELGRDDRESEDILDLMEKISLLQMENSDLRDRNDELGAENDCLSSELNMFKSKKTNNSANNKQNSEATTNSESESEQTVNAFSTSPNIGMATKRRGDSPSKTRLSEESPRLGKVRKRSTDNSNSDSDTNNGELLPLNAELEVSNKALLKADFSKEFVESLKSKIAELESRLQSCDKTEQMDEDKPKDSENPKEQEESKTENSSTKCLQCQELENSLELMRREFDNLEDYWQSKLNEERQLFDEEQRINDEKFNDLLQKMLEYEDQFASSVKKEEDECDKRLSPIDEKDFLEQQYLELELELDELKAKHKRVTKEKNEEIKALKNEVKKQQSQTPSNVSLDRTSTPESPASSPISYLWNQSTIYGPARDYHNPNWKPTQNGPVASTNAKEENPVAGLYGLSTTAITTWTSSNPEINSNQSNNSIQDVEEPPIVISPIQKPKPSPNSAVDENCDKLSTTSSVGHRSTTSTYVVKPGSLIDNEQFPIDPISSLIPEPNVPNVNLIDAKEELNRLKMFEVQLQEECKELAHKKDALINELQQLHGIRPQLEKTFARTIHPNLTSRIQQLEQKNRHLQTVLRQQQQYSESLMHQTWQQQRAEIGELRNRLETQCITIADQAQKLAKADILVKELFVENSHLRANIQRLEQQTIRNNYMYQHQAPGPTPGMNGVPGYP